MAIVRTLEEQKLGRESMHSEVSATYTIITSECDGKMLQIDTYGSSKRQEKGKKSQSIRFSQSAIEQLKEIIKKL